MFSFEKLMFANLGDKEVWVEAAARDPQRARVLQDHYREQLGLADALHLDAGEDIARKDGSMGLDLITIRPVDLESRRRLLASVRSAIAKPSVKVVVHIA